MMQCAARIEMLLDEYYGMMQWIEMLLLGEEVVVGFLLEDEVHQIIVFYTVIYRVIEVEEIAGIKG